MKAKFKNIKTSQFVSHKLPIVLLLCFALNLTLSANAALLHGYVNESQGAICGNELSAVIQSNNQTPNEFRSDSCPSYLQGSWQCITVVTDSLVDTVPVGQKVIANVNFIKSGDGRVVARWVQPGWTETQTAITAFSPTQFMMDKTNYYYGKQMNGAWAARSRDHFSVVEKDKLISDSEIDQYIDGQYIGRYRTKSVLLRISPLENVALQDRKD